MQDIANEAEINKALLHYYFRSKEKLFEHILQRKMKDFIPRIQAVLRKEMSVMDKLEGIVDGYLRMLSQNPRLPIFLLYSTYRNPAIMQHMPHEIFRDLIAFIDDAIQKKQLKKLDPSQFLLSLLGMCFFPFVAWPVASHMLEKSESEYVAFLKGRKVEIMKVIRELAYETDSS